MNNNFKDDVSEGLNATPKYLHSKYFYDKKGDELFVQIMKLPEYYLTRAELDIFSNQTQDIINVLNVQPNVHFDLVEIGAGDGTKTKFLLRKLVEQNFQFTYVPIDISLNALEQLEESLSNELPKVEVIKKHGDYFNVVGSLKKYNHPKVVLCLGSNIGNLNDNKAQKFLSKLAISIDVHDKLVLGLDLIKSSTIVLPAYNDDKGITAQFNLNLLNRINKELGADFNTEEFEHQPEYDENEGIVRSYLVSNKDQNIQIKALNKSFSFKKGERIHTETSRKYNDVILKQLISGTQLEIIAKLVDGKGYFADYILKKHESQNDQ